MHKHIRLFVIITCVLITPIVLYLLMPPGLKPREIPTNDVIYDIPTPLPQTSMIALKNQPLPNEFDIVDKWALFEGFAQKLIPYENTYLIIRIGQMADETWRLVVGFLTKQENEVIANHIVEFIYTERTDTLNLSANINNLQGEQIHNQQKAFIFLGDLFKKIGRHRFEDINHQYMRTLYIKLYGRIVSVK